MIQVLEDRISQNAGCRNECGVMGEMERVETTKRRQDTRWYTDCNRRLVVQSSIGNEGC